MGPLVIAVEGCLSQKRRGIRQGLRMRERGGGGEVFNAGLQLQKPEGIWCDVCKCRRRVNVDLGED